MISKIQAAAILGSLAASVSAHGHLSAIKVDGKDFTAYDPSFQYQSPPPEVIEWSCPECQDNGFVDPSMYDDATKIACHKDATAGAKVAEVAAGGKLDISWTTWPESHVGPVIDYLAKVDDATTASTTGLKWFKIASDGVTAAGVWGVDTMIKNTDSAGFGWQKFTMPSCVAPGQYLMRVELLALHSAGSEGQAQFYQSCAQIKVTGTGSYTPASTAEIAFPGGYSPTDPGIMVSIYDPSIYTKYKAPGPAVISCGAGSAPASSAVASKPATSAAAPVASSTKVATSAAPVVSSTKVATSAAPAPTTSAIKTSAAAPVTTAKAPTTLSTIVKTAQPATSAASSAGTVAKYAQCGGKGFTGATACVSGSTCKVQNDWYSQCV